MSSISRYSSRGTQCQRRQIVTRGRAREASLEIVFERNPGRFILGIICVCCAPSHILIVQTSIKYDWYDTMHANKVLAFFLLHSHRYAIRAMHGARLSNNTDKLMCWECEVGNWCQRWIKVASCNRSASWCRPDMNMEFMFAPSPNVWAGPSFRIVCPYSFISCDCLCAFSRIWVGSLVYW